MVDPAHDDDLARAEGLLPWAANGSLGDVDRAWLDAWLARTEQSHPAMAQRWHAELAWLQRTADQAGSNIELPDPEQGLDALLGRIAADKAAARELPSVAPSSASGLWGSLLSWVSGHGPQLAGACALLVIAQGATLLLRDPIPEPLYPLQGGSGVLKVEGTVLLKVAFSAQATEEEIRTLLLAEQARIVDGPGTRLGLYVLRVKADGIEATMARLKAHRNIVESVQKTD